jgi:tRNA nucleotidyltransferase (CCA-adding enzyme)
MSERRLRTPAAIRRSIGREAERAGVVAYLVGGAVRDALRRRRVRDIDVAIEGDAVAFARGWARVSGGRFEGSSAFGTAAVELGRDAAALRVDFATSRAETYPAPAALPRVRPAPIAADLARRDFTINAMAVALNGPAKGELLDPFGGRADLARGIVRMLHAASARDDPTRAYRAVRFALRFGFRIAPETRRWVAAAIDSGAFENLSGDRLRREILLLFSEHSPSVAVRALAALRLERTISPRLGAGAAAIRRLKRVETLARRTGRPAAWPALIAWSFDLSDSERRAAALRLGLAGESLREFCDAERRASEAREAVRGNPLSALAAASRGWSADTLVAAASALAPAGAARLLRAWSLASRVRLKISGDDLKRSGVLPGPAIGRALEETWRARIDRRIPAARELSFALSELRK